MHVRSGLEAGICARSSSVARARTNALLIDASVVSSASTTSAVRKLRTSRHERGAMAGRQVLQRGRECQPHGSSGLVVRLGRRGGIGEPVEQHVGVRRVPSPGESDRDDPSQLQLAYADRAGSVRPSDWAWAARPSSVLPVGGACGRDHPAIRAQGSGGTRGGGCQPEPLRDAAATQPAVHRCLPELAERAVVIVSGGLENKQTGRIYKTAMEVAVANDWTKASSATACVPTSSSSTESDSARWDL